MDSFGSCLIVRALDKTELSTLSLVLFAGGKHISPSFPPSLRTFFSVFRSKEYFRNKEVDSALEEGSSFLKGPPSPLPLKGFRIKVSLTTLRPPLL